MYLFTLKLAATQDTLKLKTNNNQRRLVVGLATKFEVQCSVVNRLPPSNTLPKFFVTSCTQYTQ